MELPFVRTKIVCTVGPASESRDTLRHMVHAGADVFRLNFSHGTHDEHRAVIRTIRSISVDMSRPLALLADLSGPKIRLGAVASDAVPLAEGEPVRLTSTEAADGTDNRFSVNIPGFHDVARTGERILLDDGKIALLVHTIDGTDVVCSALNGGIVRSRKGVNLPDTKLPIPAMTAKDEADLRFALAEGIDLVALSFVRNARDIDQCRKAMSDAGRIVPILAKIEKKEAVERLDLILRVSDGAMVARGDLGIEIPMEQVPGVQKRIIRECNRLAKPVVTATQMLESMITAPRPTRAEITDIYNAILDGTDAVMLSGETAVGKYPVDAVEVMHNVAIEAERLVRADDRARWSYDPENMPTVTTAICQAAVNVAESLHVDLMIVPTETGYSAYRIASFRPAVPIFACSASFAVVNALCLVSGVISRSMPATTARIDPFTETDTLIAEAVRNAKHHGIARPGMRALVIGGIPRSSAPQTNTIRAIEIT